MKLRITLQEGTHNKLSVITKYLCFIGYFGFLIHLASLGIGSYLDASTIMENPETVEASLSLDDITYEEGKRDTYAMYHFSYVFTVGNQEYRKEFSASESNADKFIDRETVTVAYLASDPSMNDRLARLEDNNSLFGFIKRFLFSALLFGFVVLLIYAYITSMLFVTEAMKEEERAEEEAKKAAK